MTSKPNKSQKQNSYTSEFKESAVKLAIESDHPITKTAKDLVHQPVKIVHIVS